MQCEEQWVTYIRLESGVSTEPDNGPDELSVEELSVEGLSDVGTVNLIGKLITHGKPHVSLVVHVLWVKSVRVVVLAIRHASIQVVYEQNENDKVRSTCSGPK